MTREEAIADIRDNIKPVVGGKSLDMAIKALEQTRWIPVSERLPEKATRVLTSWVYVPTGAKYIEVAERWGDDDDYTFYGDTDEYKMNRKDHKVIAWMPLPQPYKSESEDKE